LGRSGHDAGLSEVRYVHLGVAARRCGIHRCDDLWQQRPYKSPPSFADDHNGNLAARKVLLIPDILAGGDKQIEPGCLGCVKKPAGAQRVPSLFSRFLDRMTQRLASYSTRCAVVEKNQHSGPGYRCIKTAGGKVEHSLNLLACDRKLFHQFVDRHAVFEIFKDNGHRHTRFREKPKRRSPCRGCFRQRGIGTSQALPFYGSFTFIVACQRKDRLPVTNFKRRGLT
jgi:hypothetical protein